MYKHELKAMVEQGDIGYPEGVVVLDDDENAVEDRLTDFPPEKKIKQNDDNDNSASGSIRFT